MIQKKIKELLKIVSELQAEYKEFDKKFTLDGRLVGDLGEVLAMAEYKIRLFDKVEKKYDAVTEYDKTEVQIKTTMKNSIWYPRDHHPKLLLAIEITPNGEIIELYNGETSPFIDYIKNNRTRNDSYNYYTITKGTLIELNKKADPNSRIKKR
ncbi:DUF6998 domain-containing protein [Parvicella tangerina]|uniref:DUF6998 domain-containing protein n=1 Tax=Parvicella tangerina TaxID=2829795 RepID=A0A916JRQ0_9FLAO|nr:hypothetical protein [Parvicella tangerina]CAG5087712.1 hypothetical protein CRYO30217_03557 [Parvicella tangerina]